MNTDQINEAFEKLIAETNAHEKLGLSTAAVRTMRYNLYNNIPIALDRKIEMLKKAGLFGK